MSIELISKNLTQLINYPYLILTSFVWLTYHRSLKCGFVSDDIPGIAEYDGKLQGLEYGMLSRWIRYWICGGNFPSGKFYLDQTGKSTSIPILQGKVPWRHHLLSIIIFNLAIIAGYPFLSSILGPKIALMSLILLIVHPLTTQVVAWPSGLGYPLSLFWMFCSLNLVNWYYSLYDPSIMTSVIVFVFFLVINLLAINALFIALMLWIILAYIGYYPFAILSSIISFYLGFKIVKQTISMRTNEFKKQNMGGSTYIKPRKLIVATKTLWYYFRHILIPKRMGLYHEWGFHYDDSIERDDKEFIVSLIFIISLICFFFMTNTLEIKFGIVWFISFIFIFLNWITIQQFVTERYAFVPCLGIMIFLSYYLQNYILVYSFIIGGYMIRSIMHIPTYDNEIKFYQSNIWNFPKSEVAYGNLGVSYLRIGMVGTALDCWNTSIRINPDYDVPYYNIYSHYRSNAFVQIQHGNFVPAIEMLKQASLILEKCINAKICHFKEQWTKELNEIKVMISNPSLIIQNEIKRQQDLFTTLSIRRSKSTDPKDIEGIDQSLKDITNNLKIMNNK